MFGVVSHHPRRPGIVYVSSLHLRALRAKQYGVQLEEMLRVLGNFDVVRQLRPDTGSDVGQVRHRTRPRNNRSHRRAKIKGMTLSILPCSA